MEAESDRCCAKGSGLQDYTSVIVDFVVRDLRPVNIVDSVEFLHLMEVAEPRCTVLCCRTVNNLHRQAVFSCQSSCSQLTGQYPIMRLPLTGYDKKGQGSQHYHVYIIAKRREAL